MSDFAEAIDRMIEHGRRGHVVPVKSRFHVVVYSEALARGVDRPCDTEREAHEYLAAWRIIHGRDPETGELR